MNHLFNFNILPHSTVSGVKFFQFVPTVRHHHFPLMNSVQGELENNINALNNLY